MVKIAKRFLPFSAICAVLRAAQMALSNSRYFKKIFQNSWITPLSHKSPVGLQKLYSDRAFVLVLN